MITIARHGLRIYNLNTDKPPMGTAYVGRPTPFGNPYSFIDNPKKPFESSLHKTKTRAEAISKFKEYCKRNLAMGIMAKKYLKGKDLSCWCVPAECHAMVLMDMANEPEPIVKKGKKK